MNKKKLFLLIIPLLFLLTGISFNRAKFSNDPEYDNLLNGVNVANMKSSGRTDNPGTTIHIFSAMVLRTAHLFDFTEKKDLQTHVIKDSEFFIASEIYILILIVAIVLFLSGHFVFKYTHKLWPSLSMQLGLLLSALSVEIIWTKISTDSFVAVSAILLVVLVLKFLFDKKGHTLLYPILFAIIIGFGTATSFTFLPIFILPFFLFKNFKQYIIYLILLVATFVIFTIPAITHYPKMFAVLFNPQIGPEKIAASTTIVIIYLQEFFGLFKSNMIILISLALSFMLLFGLVTIKSLITWAKEYKSIKIFIFLLIILFVEAISLPLIKNNLPGSIIMSLLSALILILIVVILHEVFDEKYKSKLANADIYLFILLAVFVLISSTQLYHANSGYSRTNREYAKVQQLLNSDFKSYIKTYYYPTSINKFSGLKLGNTIANKNFNNLLAEIYPGALFFDVRNQTFYNWENEYPLSVLISDSSNNKVLIIGGPLTKEDLAKAETGGLELIEKYKGIDQAVYELDTNALFKLGIGVRPIWSSCFDAENTTADKKYFTAGSCKIENNWHQSTDVAYTGTHSMKLAGENIYACTFNLDTAQSGSKYRVSVWCKNRSEQTYLVASSVKVPTFYKQISKSMLKGKDGWEKIVMEFDITAEMEGKDIKIYFWKNNRETIYLDDFTVARLK